MRRVEQNSFRERIAEYVRNYNENYIEATAISMRDLYNDTINEVDWFYDIGFEDISSYDQDAIMFGIWFDFKNFTGKKNKEGHIYFGEGGRRHFVVIEWDAHYWYEEWADEYDIADTLIEYNDMAGKLLKEVELPKWDFTFVNVS